MSILSTNVPSGEEPDEHHTPPNSGSHHNRLYTAGASEQDKLPYFDVIDLKAPWFPTGRKIEVAKLYARIFNGVEGIKPKWTLSMATKLLGERQQKPSVMIVAFDRLKEKAPIAGAFFANLVPGSTGVRMTEPDIIIAPEYTKHGLGRELSWLGRRRAGEVCSFLFHAPLTTDESQTFKNLSFPRDWWVKNGYNLVTLYTQTAKELLKKAPDPLSPVIGEITFQAIPSKQIITKQLEELSKFISMPSTQASDGGQWHTERAESFLRFMNSYGQLPIHVARRNDKIIGLITGDLIPRRSGPSLVDIHYFTKPLNQKTMTLMTAVTPRRFQNFIETANQTAFRNYEMPLYEVEIYNGDIKFFQNRYILKDIKEDNQYIAMRGPHEKLKQNFRRPERMTEYVSGPLVP